MSVDVVTFGCRLNGYEFGGHPPRSGGGRSRRRRGGQYLRRHRRSGAAGAPDHPQTPPRASGRRASSSPAARRRPKPATFAAMPEVDRVLGNSEKLDAVGLGEDALGARARAVLRHRHRRENCRQRHHGGARDRPASDRRHGRPRARLSCRSRMAAITAARFALFLTAAAIRARCRWAKWWRRCSAPGRQRLSRDRADRRRHHELWIEPCPVRRSSARW